MTMEFYGRSGMREIGTRRQPPIMSSGGFTFLVLGISRRPGGGREIWA
jgi:hypothetical protein